MKEAIQTSSHYLVCLMCRRLPHVSAGVTLSSDFIAGFCGETEEEHQDTVSLMETVKFDMAYMFAYSMRKVSAGSQTHAS